MSLNELDTLMNKLDERKSTHPNLASVWLNYLTIKKEKLEEAISDANKMLEICNRVENDMTHESIYILWCLMRNIRE